MLDGDLQARHIAAYIRKLLPMNERERDKIEDCIQMLRSFSQAYPLSMFSAVTDGERQTLHMVYPGLQDRIAADMGRHLAVHMAAAAAILESMLPPE